MTRQHAMSSPGGGSTAFESQVATNPIGHFQLTARLWPALRRAGSARVVSLGAIVTDLMRSMDDAEVQAAVDASKARGPMTTQQGAATTVWSVSERWTKLHLGS